MCSKNLCISANYVFVLLYYYVTNECIPRQNLRKDKMKKCSKSSSCRPWDGSLCTSSELYPYHYRGHLSRGRKSGEGGKNKINLHQVEIGDTLRPERGWGYRCDLIQKGLDSRSWMRGSTLEFHWRGMWNILWDKVSYTVSCREEEKEKEMEFWR